MEKELFIEWLKENGISSYGNYISRLKNVEDAEGNLDEHFARDKCAALLEKFQYTSEDKISQKPTKHSIPISPQSGGKDLYQSYYEGTGDYRNRIAKYIEFKESKLSSRGIANEDNVIEKLKKTCEKLLADKKLLSLEQLYQGYNLFTQKFDPAKLKSLDGELLVDTIFNIGNRDGLTYWLEFKNDDEFKTNSYSYGSIAGGSSFKYVMFKRNSDSKWVTGNPQNPTVLSTNEAIELGRELRNALVAGADLIDNLADDASIEDYIKLQEELSNILINNMYSLGWVHKYYHMLYPNKIDAYHTTKWQRHALICCNIKPAQEYKLYTMSGQLMQIVKETGLPSSYVMNSMCELFGSPVNYFRVGTSGENKSYWDQMKNGGYISIGWSALGDLREYEDQEKSKLRAKLFSVLENKYPNDPRANGRAASQILSFYYNINIGDIVVAVDGEKVLGVGQASDKYEYREGLDFPHIIKTEWIYISETRLPNPREGLRTTVYQYKEIDNILEIEKLANTQFVSSTQTAPSITPITPLNEFIAKIESVLSRKKQVILYGPPGTGKTYNAEKACTELAARNLFNKSFDMLTSNERNAILGDGRTSGVVRMCCFHPSYSYEDFIEGIKPNVVNNQTIFSMKPGIFKNLCDEAKKNSNQHYFLIIDEINRGDISRIFGELITIVETGKRGKEMLLPLSGECFSVPENVYIVGTMNTADRSIALLDVALRRRFGFIELMPDYSLLSEITVEGLPVGLWLKELNRRIVEFVGRDARNLQIGHSYFMENSKPIKDFGKLRKIIQEDVIPLIEEYCYGDYITISKILGNSFVDVSKQEIKHDLFKTTNKADLTAALLETSPDLATSTSIQIDDTEDDEELEFEDAAGEHME